MIVCSEDFVSTGCQAVQHRVVSSPSPGLKVPDTLSDRIADQQACVPTWLSDEELPSFGSLHASSIGHQLRRESQFNPLVCCRLPQATFLQVVIPDDDIKESIVIEIQDTDTVVIASLRSKRFASQ